MKRILSTLAVILTAFYVVAAGTNTMPANTALMINYTNFNIVFPTGATQRTSFLATNDIQSASGYATGTNALHVVDVSLQAQIDGITSTNGYVGTGTFYNVSNRVTTLEAATNALTDSKMGAFTGSWMIVYSGVNTQKVELPLGISGSFLRSSGPGSAPTFSSVPVVATNMSLSNLVDTISNGWFVIGDGTNLIARSQAYTRTNLGLVVGTDVQAYHTNLQTFTTNMWNWILASDGAGSGLDADLFDGFSSAYFADYASWAATNLIFGAAISAIEGATNANRIAATNQAVVEALAQAALLYPATNGLAGGTTNVLVDGAWYDASSLFGGGSGGSWWTNPPSSAVTFLTNSWSVDTPYFRSLDGTNFEWVAINAATGTVDSVSGGLLTFAGGVIGLTTAAVSTAISYGDWSFAYDSGGDLDFHLLYAGLPTIEFSAGGAIRGTANYQGYPIALEYLSSGVASNYGAAGAGYYGMSNGAWTAFTAGGGDASAWSQYAATQAVNMGGNNITNVPYLTGVSQVQGAAGDIDLGQLRLNGGNWDVPSGTMSASGNVCWTNLIADTDFTNKVQAAQTPGGSTPDAVTTTNNNAMSSAIPFVYTNQATLGGGTVLVGRATFAAGAWTNDIGSTSNRFVIRASGLLNSEVIIRLD